MATHQIPILTAHTSPDASGGVFFEPYNVKATNDVFRHLVLVFNNSTAVEGVYGAFVVPQNYVGTPVVTVLWTTIGSPPSGAIKLDFDYRAIGGNDTESLDQASFQESLTVTTTAPSATDERVESSFTLTGSNLAAGDIVEYFLTRESSNAADTLSAAITVHGVVFQYTDV